MVSCLQQSAIFVPFGPTHPTSPSGLCQMPITLGEQGVIASLNIVRTSNQIQNQWRAGGGVSLPDDNWIPLDVN